MKSTLTTKGQITLPVEIRRRCNLRPGDRVEFVVRDDGAIEMVPLSVSVRSLKGMIPRPRKAVTLEGMRESVARGGTR